MESNHYGMKPRFQRIVWIACYFTVFMIVKTAYQNISKTLSKNLLNTYSLKRFLQKTPGTEKHVDKRKAHWRHYVYMATLIAIKPRS